MRKACRQYFGKERGAPSSQSIREMLHREFPARIAKHQVYQDASEILSLMLERVPAGISQAAFPLLQETRQFAPTGVTKAIGAQQPDQRTLLGDDGATVTENYDPLIRIEIRRPTDPRDPTGRAPLAGSVVDFDQMLPLAYSAPGGEDGWFLGDDPSLLYEHSMVQTSRQYMTMPTHLLMTSNRFQFDRNVGDTTVVDTPMQMGRVLTLPADSLPDAFAGDPRLVLRSFVVFQPGHYVSYVKMGNQWYCCDDSTVTPKTVAEVDNVLYHYRGGGSYVHYYEQGNADAEPAMTVRHNVELENAQTTEQLETLQKLCDALDTPPDVLAAAFDKLPQDVKNKFFGKIYELEGKKRQEKGLGKKLLLADVRLLAKHKLLEAETAALKPKKKAIPLSQTEIMLELMDKMTKNTDDAVAWLALFNQLEKRYRDEAATLVWLNSEPRSDVPNYGALEIAKDPTCLLAPLASDKTSKLRIVDHLLTAVLSRGKTLASRKLVPKSTDTQVEIALKLSEALQSKDGKAQDQFALFGRLEKRYQDKAAKLVYENKTPKPTVPRFGKLEIERNPRCLLDPVAADKAKHTIMEVIVADIMEDAAVASASSPLGFDYGFDDDFSFDSGFDEKDPFGASGRSYGVSGYGAYTSPTYQPSNGYSSWLSRLKGRPAQNTTGGTAPVRGSSWLDAILYGSSTDGKKDDKP